MMIEELDHLVLTVADIQRSMDFYAGILGMESEWRDGRASLRFGRQKINLHRKGRERRPHAGYPLPGSADICFITATPLEKVIVRLQSHSIEIIAGPVERDGAIGPLRSIYLRDPDDNLIEIANRIKI